MNTKHARNNHETVAKQTPVLPGNSETCFATVFRSVTHGSCIGCVTNETTKHGCTRTPHTPSTSDGLKASLGAGNACVRERVSLFRDPPSGSHETDADFCPDVPLA